MRNLCKHRRTWMIAGGHYEWCYECGAVRGMRFMDSNSIAPRTYWERPVGMRGQNPAMWRDVLKDLPARKPRSEAAK